MKNQVSKTATYLLNSLVLLFFSVLSFAQEDGGIDVDVDLNPAEESGELWYQNPLYWVIGALLLIILVAVLARGRK